MYGAMDFVNRIIPAAEQAHKWMFPYYFVNPFETGFAPMDETSSPSVARRGLWTWGHVIYDYRGYLTNMARLKLNELVIWNDFAPLNADEIVAFAHGLGIRIIWGYSWGWDTSIKTDLSDPLALHALEDSVVDTFVRHYAALPGDGIYFPELHRNRRGGTQRADYRRCRGALGQSGLCPHSHPEARP